ncbi:STE/STE7/MEK1 protein kinase [Salpingoeca rosetta]|uniref:STE/STE7/MEK1 protein kinase n=1 Tax=Salpingoeca rosetta (strain ATCC 50818 / BSB-021) TaxID=946362 RepID=F2U8D5_SALR5|nr:STE/STE7/MEK1 protein kinase [Salpingoeca rosetta]EGD72643.1 STE/STE7/MEK1 protein kinase [Salpingoeca rosetta]|eukprot:XP_004994466.1 STE/STE7/MEK1 protein kinase [Salpingoeca rosetta]
MTSLAERRAAKKGLGKGKFQLPSLSPPSPVCATPPPLRSLKASLRGYKGPDRRSMQDFIFNKERFLNACDLNIKAFETLETLAEGEGRGVHKVRHTHTDLILVQKIVHYDHTEETHRVLQRELDLLHDCHAPEVVNFYGSFMERSEVHIIMEYMNGGCLDDVLNRIGRIDEHPLVHICHKVLRGLLYLEQEKIIHRDLKPANILVNTEGDVKLCDFGVSRRLITTRANTFVGTMRYMSPERLHGEEYTVKSDIWSLGISLLEMATGVYPYLPDVDPKNLPMMPKKDPDTKSPTKRSDLAVFDVISSVVKGPLPRLPAKIFSAPFERFVADCLHKKAKDRMSLELLKGHEWITTLGAFSFNMSDWVKSTLPTKRLQELEEDTQDEFEEEPAVRVMT